ncbi:MAG: SGNH/GDSL hydrolase family protein [Alphaproteobacteria bacterium]|nr:SGNH/GDSL hydrolase family protein [Alphaproteobacteria bacterium]
MKPRGPRLPNLSKFSALLLLAGIAWCLGAADRAAAQVTAALSVERPREPMLGGRGCACPSRVARLDGIPPRALMRLKNEESLRIVAIGSSSTEGIGASSPDRAYPNQLQIELSRRYPMSTIRVLNKGIGGELVTDMAARLERDVIDQRPDLVIWQTGTNDALRGIAAEAFGKTLRDGIARLREAGIDVMVLTPQYTPRIAAAGVVPYRELFDHLSRDAGVAVFHRLAVMRAWVENGRFSFDTMLAGDHFHMNDRSYACLAQVLADAIERAAAE